MRDGPAPSANERIYVIGEINGCFDLLAKLIWRIRADADSRRQRETRLVFLGGLINRGTQSADVVTRVRQLTQITGRLVVLAGIDEQMLIQAMAGDLDVLEAWLCRGGDATLRSWGVETATIDGPLPELLNASRKAIGSDLLRWLAALPHHYRSGNYLFVHTGINPRTPLEVQGDNLSWLNSAFVGAKTAQEAVIVHGHARSGEAIELLPHRIGLGSGAWWSGTLSAIGLENDQRWVVST